MMSRARYLPYYRLMRLHQPAGTWLLLWPCWWSLALVGERHVLIYALFALGALVMRSAGCIINDMWDRTLDAQVERTQNRPLANGDISLRQATLLLAALLSIALAIAIILGMRVMMWSSLSLPLVAAYPLMKRITWWPQIFLGLTFNWGVLVASIAARGEVTFSALLLYIGCVFWTLGYDTIYAHQDKYDDARIGIKSTAQRLGHLTKPFVASFYAIFLCCLFLAAQPTGWSLFFFTCVALHFAWQLKIVYLNIPASCQKIFASNTRIGLLIFACIALNNI